VSAAGYVRPAALGELWETAAVPGYTIVNLKEEVEDSAPKFGFAPDLEARFATGALELEKSGISYQRLAPGFRIPFGHKHGHQEEVYVLVGGSARLKLDDQVVELKQWDAVRVPGETMRAFEAGPEGAELLAFGAPNTGVPSTDTEMEQSWWKD
jgi:mannose-6-phosphate isomerase-like protein (cupin superfamily)